MAHGFLTLLILARLLSNIFSNLAGFIGKFSCVVLLMFTGIAVVPEYTAVHVPEVCGTRINLKIDVPLCLMCYVFGQSLCMQQHSKPSPDYLKVSLVVICLV